ncbi:hypothetical protein LMH87_011973 [Akanthomyces muscarius]|uniref:Uncharacterized protein n=1 Tax=Akanthomyces muscarius TaxID=2231603 RepID=A0A9W8QCE1_AKAMU|nr:hypothetical protein LMH87_011973 [Akanthomyces muscarius]KAJ4151262.1 hypothetical protein LMH87_011973 [Akanthomyces muscarius]
MKPSVVIAALTTVVSAEFSTTYRCSSSYTAGTSPLSELSIANPNSDFPTTFATLPRRKELEFTTTHLTADPWPTTFQQFEPTTRRPKTRRLKKTRCTEPPAQFPTTFQQFPSVYRAKQCQPTKGHHIPDASSAHPAHITKPVPSILDPWEAHQPHIVITPTTTLEVSKTTTTVAYVILAAHVSKAAIADASGEVQNNVTPCCFFA